MTQKEKAESILYFRAGKMDGFTFNEHADKWQGWATPIRELLQNSMDASTDRDCKIDVYIQSIEKFDIPHIEEYEEVLKKSIHTLDMESSYNATSQQHVQSIKDALQETEMQALLFVDNGSGMQADKLKGLLDGRSVSKGDESAGSFGLGHLTSYSLSSLHYVLYATKYKDEHGEMQELFTGSPILAGHNDDGIERGGQGTILKHKPENELMPKFYFPDQFPDFMQPAMDAVQETGALVAILGLSEEWSEEAEYAIASNYFHAIAFGRLLITVHRNGQKHEISAEKAEQLITNNKNNKNRRKGETILSGQAVYQALCAVNSSDNQKTIVLSNSEEVHVCIHSDDNANSAIVLIRNGMVIARHDDMLSNDIEALRKNSDFEPFTAVIDVSHLFAPKLFDLIKRAEGAYHNELRPKKLNQQDEIQLKKLLKELSAGIEKHLNKVDRESFALPLFQTSSESATTQALSGIAEGQSEKASPQKKNTKIDVKTHKKAKKKGRKAPTVTSRILPSRTALRYTDQGETWKVHLKIIPEDYQHDRNDVYFSLWLGEDHDQGKVANFLNFETVRIGEKSVDIDPKNPQVKLGSLKPGAPYTIVAEVKKPVATIGNMKVSLQPILGLKKCKKPVTENPTKSES